MTTPKPPKGAKNARAKSPQSLAVEPSLPGVDAPQRVDHRVITIRGAREHNLKNVDLTIPRDKLVVFTGLSGSGKSSLAFDTIYAEGQRRYVESLSAYARQFLEMMSTRSTASRPPVPSSRKQRRKIRARPSAP